MGSVPGAHHTGRSQAWGPCTSRTCSSQGGVKPPFLGAWGKGGCRVCFVSRFLTHGMNTTWSVHVFFWGSKSGLEGCGGCDPIASTVSNVRRPRSILWRKRGTFVRRGWERWQPFCHTKQILLSYWFVCHYDLFNQEHLVLLTPDGKYFEAGCTICHFWWYLYLFLFRLSSISIMTASHRWRVNWSIRCVP